MRPVPAGPEATAVERAVVSSPAALQGNQGLRVTLSNDRHSLELGWQAARGAGANDGWLQLEIDGEAQYPALNLDTDTRQVSELRLGVLSESDPSIPSASGISVLESLLRRPKMAKVALVTDSTAYLPQDLLTQYSITVAPLVLIWGEETFADGVDILPGEFYARLKTAKTMPSTSQVSPSTFEQIFRRLLEQDYQVLALLIATTLSGTVASALQARQMLPNAPIEIVDSGTTTMALGFQVLAVARAAAQGATLKECRGLAEAARQHTGVVFAVDTLEFLHRGGRIGGGSRFLGTALNIKPILEVVDGQVEAVERVRTRKKSLARLAELTCEHVQGRTPVHLATLHANAWEDAQELEAISQQYMVSDEQLFSELSPVIGTHTGPGTVGLAFMAGI